VLHHHNVVIKKWCDVVFQTIPDNYAGVTRTVRLGVYSFYTRRVCFTLTLWPYLFQTIPDNYAGVTCAVRLGNYSFYTGCVFVTLTSWPYLFQTIPDNYAGITHTVRRLKKIRSWGQSDENTSCIETIIPQSNCTCNSCIIIWNCLKKIRS
jgi:hypothetical protein